MEVFRLVRQKYSYELSGAGSAMNGARWNSKGVEMIYTSINRSLAMAEVLVHFTAATLP
ncbi:MAG TPA: RES superfamily protein, partial [Bacteroidetes bacterium]|nr:RES superfamily protein [Bacteroidota bacterium]